MRAVLSLHRPFLRPQSWSVGIRSPKPGSSYGRAPTSQIPVISDCGPQAAVSFLVGNHSTPNSLIYPPYLIFHPKDLHVTILSLLGRLSLAIGTIILIKIRPPQSVVAEFQSSVVRCSQNLLMGHYVGQSHPGDACNLDGGKARTMFQSILAVPCYQTVHAPSVQSGAFEKQLS
jgi:hypothetical protein